MSWQFGFVMPNIEVDDSTEWDDVAIVPAVDDRVQELCRSSNVICALVSNFKNNFQRTLKPAVLIYRKKENHKKINLDTLLVFRNSIAISTITGARADSILSSNIFSPIWSDAFDIYPIVPGIDETHWVSVSPASTSMGRIDKFMGQSSAECPRTLMRGLCSDKLLHDYLQSLWPGLYAKRNAMRNNLMTRLLRSLEFAYLATGISVAHKGSLNDLGVVASYWVSAFEVLINHGGDRVGSKQVVAALNQIVSEPIHRLQKKQWRIAVGRDSVVQCNYYAKLYWQIYCLRNAFMHGNQLSVRLLKPRRMLPIGDAIFAVSLVYREYLVSLLRNECPFLRELELGGRGKYFWVNGQITRALTTCSDPVSYRNDQQNE